MEEKEIFGKINEMLEESDYPLEIKDISDLEDFLNDENNQRFEAFESIGRLYDELIDEPDIGRFTDY